MFPTHRQNRQMLTYQKVIQNHATGEQGRENTYWNGDMGKMSKVVLNIKIIRWIFHKWKHLGSVTTCFL